MKKVEKTELMRVFGEDIEKTIETEAPSWVEYSLLSLAEDAEEEYLSPRQIESKLDCFGASIYFDYYDQAFIEVAQGANEEINSLF